eukprot:11217333-Lingulodinium_polyedra.AAC.1
MEMLFFLLEALQPPPASAERTAAVAFVALACDCYLRPMEAVSLRADQVAPPVGAAANKGWLLSIAPATAL